MTDMSEPVSEQEEQGGVLRPRVGEAPQTPAPALRFDARRLGRIAGNQHIQRLLDRVRGHGRPIDAAVRRALEPIFGRDLGRVRVHTDPEAQSAALEVGASAVTRGEDIYFGPGRYDTASPAGRSLIAHEVAHTVQQTETAGPQVPALAAEGEAQRAAEVAGAGRRLDFALSATEPVPALAPGAWGDDVRAAQALSGAAQASAMLALVQRALSGIGITVKFAGSTSPTRVDPADYAAAPTLNFDPNLNGKQSWPSTPGGPTRSLSINYGYFFTSGAAAYAVIGPKALDPDSEIFTQMYANHELYHTQHHTPAALGSGAARVPSADQELETWTHDFTGYFHQLHHFGPQWAPLIRYYESATPAARSAALNSMVSYHNNPPVAPSEVAGIKKAFERWLRRRLGDMGNMQLVKDLSAALSITLPPKTP